MSDKFVPSPSFKFLTDGLSKQCFGHSSVLEKYGAKALNDMLSDLNKVVTYMIAVP